jgi:6-phosphogluconolactonase (cycloisomerase 2 family)
MNNPEPGQQRRARRSLLKLPADERRALSGQMRRIARYLLILAAGASLLPPILSAQELTTKKQVVFVMTNGADRNQVIAYESSSNGGFTEAGRFDTGGRGSGGSLMPFESQGSLTLSQDRSLLFAVNPGSGELSVFHANGASLSLVDKKPTGGAAPVSVAQRQNVVYVLDQGGSGAVVGFKLDASGHLKEIPKSTALLSSNLVAGQDVTISPDGQFVVVIELFTNNVDTFKIQPDGTLGPIVANPGPALGAFSSCFTQNGTLIVTEGGTPTQSEGAISSYTIATNGTLVPITQNATTIGLGACWNVVTPNGKFVYGVNSDTSNIFGFNIASNGALTPIASTVLASDPANSASIDIAVSSDGKFLFNLNPGSSTIGVFGIRGDGTLSTLTPIQIGPDSAPPFSGIAAS